jgi:glycosyltransferase involved in cell wall biosynthesis
MGEGLDKEREETSMTRPRSLPAQGAQFGSPAKGTEDSAGCAPPEALFDLSFDHYQRYAVTRKITNILRASKGDRPFSILDVGGCGSSLKHYLPRDTVALADIVPPRSTTYPRIPFYHDHYILASGTALPFADDSVDIVMAHDTLEHVPETERSAFLREVIRVAQQFVILNGPVYRPETAAAEQRLALFMERTSGQVNPYLAEHLANGLPHDEDITAVIDEGELPFVTVPNGDLGRWLLVMGLKFYALSLPNSGPLLEVLEPTYNAFFSDNDFGDVCYRVAYVVAKNRSLAKGLRELEKAFAPMLAQAPFPIAAESIESILQALETHASNVRRQAAQMDAAVVQRDALLAQSEAALAEKDRALAEKHGALAEKDRVLAEKDATLREKDAALAEKESLIARRQEALEQLMHELVTIRQSLGYRILEGYRRPIRWLFPPGSWRGLPYRALRRVIRWLLNVRHRQTSIFHRAMKAQRHYGTKALVGKSINHLTGRPPDILDPVAYALGVDWRARRSPEVIVRQPLDTDRPTINWVIPTVGEGGGHLTIFRFAEFLQKRGCRQRIYEMPVGRPPRSSREELTALIQRLYHFCIPDVNLDFDDMAPADITVATSWHTAYPVVKFAETRKKFYFVLDFEPLFTARGTESALAENTYRFGFHGITGGRWLAERLSRDFGMECNYFNLAVDPQTYFPKNLAERKKIFFYARPATPRRGFRLGLKALEIFHSRNPSYQIVFAGADLAQEKFPFPVTNIGYVSAQHLNDLYNESAAALVVSLTNCSLLPPEIMATGCPVVTTTGDNNEMVLPADSAIFAAPSPHHLAEALENAVRNPPIRQELIKKATQFRWEDEMAKVKAMFGRLLREECGQ